MKLSSGAQRLLKFVRYYVRLPKGCVAGLKYISDRICASGRSVKRWLAELREAGLVRAEYHGRNGFSLFLTDRGPENGPEKQPVSIYTNPNTLRIQRSQEYSTEEVAPALTEICIRLRNPLPKPGSYLDQVRIWQAERLRKAAIYLREQNILYGGRS